MLPDYRDWLRGCDVVARAPVVIPRSAAKVFLNEFLPPRQSAAPAHGKIMADMSNFHSRIGRSFPAAFIVGSRGAVVAKAFVEEQNC
jgi:hypothetical protein